MPFPLLPLLGALGPLFMGGASLAGGAMANAANKKRAQEQMDFQERMSSTSYQRATEDMRMSGINPMLAYQQGGASSPGGAQASMQDVISPAVSSAMHARRMGAELKLLEAQTQSTQQDAASKYIWNQGTSGLEQERIKEEIQNIRARTANDLLESSARRMALPGAANRERFEKSWMGRWSPFVEPFAPFLRTAAGAAGFGAGARFIAPMFGSGSSSAMRTFEAFRGRGGQ